MSRLASLSPAALRAMFSQDSDDDLVALLTFSGTGIATPIRIADNYTGRLSSTDTDVVYGLTSRGNDYLFIPFTLTLPTEEVQTVPRCEIKISDVTQILLPSLRTITTAPDVLIELVLKSTPNTVEASFPGFKMSAINYNADTISGTLTVPQLATEPFPAHTFTPSYFPGLF